MDPSPSTIADRIRWILRERGLSQRALSARAGLAPSHISLILTGRLQGNLHGSTLAALARAGGVSLEWLQSGAGEPTHGAVEATEAPPALAVRETDGPLGRALVRALDPEAHELADVDSVRSALAGVDLAVRADGDLVGAARQWLDAAASIRRRGGRVSAGAILAELAPIRADTAAAANAEGDRKARELGVEPGSAAAALAEKLGKTRTREK